MKRVLFRTAILLFVLLASFHFITPTHAAETTITLLNPPPGGVLELGVGDSYTFEFEVTSDTPFVHASALPAPFFPGRGVFITGADHARGGTTALLSLTVTGKNSTENLPGGYAPISMFVGMRYQGGVTVSEQFDVLVAVP